MESKLLIPDDAPDQPEDRQYQEKDKEGLKVKVALRIRPLIKRDLVGDYQIAIIPEGDSKVIKIGDKKRFAFDQVFSKEATQDQIWSACATKLIDSCFSGYNGTIMAYGQTGSGKTYTMGNCMETNEDDKGIIPRTIDEVFRRMEERQDEFNFIVRATYVEIYNEEIYDLLTAPEGGKFTRNKSNSVSLREEKDGSILICGVREEKIDDKEELYLLLDQGNRRRSVGSTDMNDESSRSHAIFTLIIEKSVVDDEKDFVCSRFSFVDLAGSERLERTRAVGKSMKEGININKGLLALGNVISALTDDTGKVTFIPYRVSKLTRILRNSLGGNSRTWMIACVSPVLADLDESLNTIKYATRARKISNTPIVNKDPQSAIIAQLKQQVFKLQSDVLKMKRVINHNGLTAELDDIDDVDDLGGDSPTTGRRQNERTSRLSRRDTMLEVEHAGDFDYRMKQAEKEILKIKEQRNKAKKELNEKNILYCKLIGRAADLRSQNQELLAALEMRTGQMLGETGEGIVDVAAAILASTIKKENNDDLVSLVKEIDSLKSKLAEKTRYSSTLEDEYTKLLRISTKENELLVEKVKEIAELQQLLRRNDRTSILRDSGATSDLHLMKVNSMNDGGSGLEDSTTMIETSMIYDIQAEDDDTEKFQIEKDAQEEEIKKLMDSLNEKEMQLKQMMEVDKEEELQEIELLTEREVVNLDRLTDLEQQLMDVQKERDIALKQIKTDQIFNSKASIENLNSGKKPTKNSDGQNSKEQEVVTKYKSKVSDLEHQILELRKRDKDVKKFDSKLQEKNTKIEALMTEISKIKVQKISLDKKLREGTQTYAKSKLEKQKEILSIKKELFKKNAEVSRLKNNTRKQDLAFHKKLIELRKNSEKSHFSKKTLKKVNSDTFEEINIDAFSQLMQMFCNKICDYVELEKDIEVKTNALLIYHSQLDDLFDEISRLEVQKQVIQGEDVDEEIGLMEAKQDEFKTNMASCEEAIKIKKGYLSKLESELEYLKEFIDDGFASLLQFLSEHDINREVFWETALNVMMYELESLKKSQVAAQTHIKEADAEMALQKKSVSEAHKTMASLEQEVEKLKKELEEKGSLHLSKLQGDESSKHRFEDDTPASSIYENSGLFHFKSNPKPEFIESRGRASTNMHTLKHVKLDSLRNKLMNTEIQKEGAIKMAETFREKYFKMQELITTIIDQTPTAGGLPPDPTKKDKFIKTYKRHGFGSGALRSGKHSHNNSMQIDPAEKSPPTAKNRRRINKDGSEIGLLQMSRDNSKKRKNSGMGLLNSSFQGKLPDLHNFENMEESVNLYSKELQKR